MSALGPKDLVEDAGELGVPIVEKEPWRQLAVLNLPSQVPGLLLDPGPVRMASASCQMDATRTDLDEEEDVELGQPDGIDNEEVGRK